MMHSFLSLLKHDIFEGVICKWKYYFLAILFFIFVDFVFVTNVNSSFVALNTNIQCSISDIVINTFLGNEPFDPAINKGVSLSITWFVFHAFLFSFISFYITNDLKKNTTSIILRVKSKKLWWTSKFIWCIATVLLYYSLFFAIAIIFASCFGIASFGVSNLIADKFFGIQILNISVWKILFSSLLLPMIISIAIAVFESALSLMFKPIYSFIVLICYLVASSFYYSEYLLFNFSMVIRNNFEGVNGVSNQYGMLIAILLIVVSYFVGMTFIKRKDIL